MAPPIFIKLNTCELVYLVLCIVTVELRIPYPLFYFVLNFFNKNFIELLKKKKKGKRVLVSLLEINTVEPNTDIYTLSIFVLYTYYCS